MSEKRELDLEIIKSLYRFGGLMVFRVVRFNDVSFLAETHRYTLSHEVAIEELEKLKRNGMSAKIDEFIVNFDGAYSK